MAKLRLKFSNQGFIETTHLILCILIIAIIISVVLTAFLFIRPIDQNSAPRNPVPTLSRDAMYFFEAKDEYSRSGAGKNMVDAIGALQISDALAQKIKTDPSYQATVSSLLIPWPTYSANANNAQVKEEYKKFLTENVSKVSDTVFDETSNTNTVLGQLLTILYYAASVGNSPEMDQGDVSTWRYFLETGKEASQIIAAAPVRKREETIVFTENFFKQPVFVKLGVK